MKHTRVRSATPSPGPWGMKIEKRSITITAPDPEEPDAPWNVAEVWSCGYDDEHAEANALLIRAAPDLLECVVAGARYSDALKALQDAGAGPGMVEGSDELDRLLGDWHDKAHAVLAKLKG